MDKPGTDTTTGTATGAVGGTADAARAEAVLCDPSLDGVVDMVLRPVATDRYRVANAAGSIEFERQPDGPGWRHEVVVTDGTNPLQDQDSSRFTGLDDEQANLFPSNRDNAYPEAFARCTSVFDHACAPDLVVIHRSGQRFASIGDHGSLAVVQSRAVCIAAGAGVTKNGLVPGHARMVDIAPTVMRLLGAAPHPHGIGANGSHHPEALLARQDGSPIDAFLNPDAAPAEHVVVILIDGTNANLAYSAADSGRAPNLAALIERGTALRQGVLASLPTATLANHTTAMTGCEPGNHGVLHNEWFDAATGRSPNLLDPAQMFGASGHIVDDVETIHEAVHRAFPGSFTATTFEYGDRGADWSTYAQVREGAQFPIPDKTEPLPDATEEFLEERAYRFMSRIDTASAQQAVDLWSGGKHPLPTFSFFNFSLTDEAGHHGGPHSEEALASLGDSDRRIGRILDAIDASGKTDSTAVIVMADHGMETTNPEQTASFEPALEAAGIAHRNLGHGFVYLD